MREIKEWTKEGLLDWFHEVNVFEHMTRHERGQLIRYFISEANKHQDNSLDRWLYRVGIKIVDSGYSKINQPGGRNFERFLAL